MQIEDKPSLYERLGGVYTIAMVMDDFINRVIVDPRMNANPDIHEAHRLVSPPAFKYVVTEMTCWAAGGRQTYCGRPKHGAHRHLVISYEEWLAFMDDFQQTLDAFRVPQPEQRELTAIVAAWSGNARRRLYLAIPADRRGNGVFGSTLRDQQLQQTNNDQVRLS